ncbi:hypothetical protein ACFFJB_07915 [Camelimonas abortus]|uniref:Uncharacterized protein n=1 Tax=Camelimonas abortus TaxID=1017184 RepID=A0ABV7LH86_9HYPH
MEMVMDGGLRAAALAIAFTLALAAAPAGAGVRAPEIRPAARPAQFVCDSAGCGLRQGAAAPAREYLGRPYIAGTPAEREALAERDRLRRERARREGDGGVTQGSR